MTRRSCGRPPPSQSERYVNAVLEAAAKDVNISSVVHFERDHDRATECRMQWYRRPTPTSTCFERVPPQCGSTPTGTEPGGRVSYTAMLDIVIAHNIRYCVGLPDGGAYQ